MNIMSSKHRYVRPWRLNQYTVKENISYTSLKKHITDNDSCSIGSR